MIAASCSEDVPTLALLAAEVKRIRQKNFTFSTSHNFRPRSPLRFRRFVSSRRSIDALRPVCYIKNRIFARKEARHENTAGAAASGAGGGRMPAAGRTARRTQRAPDRVRARAAGLGRAGCALPRRALLGTRGGRRARLSQPLRIRLPRGLGRHHLERVGPRVRALCRAHRRQGRLRHRARAALRSRALRHGISRAARARLGRGQAHRSRRAQLRRRDGAAAHAAARARLPRGGAGGRGRR